MVNILWRFIQKMINEIIIAGLLHDIGKFMQRAFKGLDILSPQSKNMESMLCPVRDNRYTHLHVLFTNEFCEKNLSNLPQSFDKTLMINLACYHHKPSDEQQKIIQEADWLSSGMERLEDDSYEGPQNFRKVRLRSIMPHIDIGKGTNDVLWEHTLETYQPSNVFPVKHDNTESRRELTEEYNKLWEEFIEDWDKNKVKEPWGFINRAASVLEHFTWCIPSATNVMPDISLFDHCKTTAAIAACLSLSPDNTSPFLLIAGDFTGIQKYIFDIKKGHGGYAKRLRARSFFVSLLSESVSLKILRTLELPITQRIMFAGGKFHLLLPNTKEVLETVNSIKFEIDQWLWKTTGGDIRFSIVTKPLKKEGLINFSETLTDINHTLRTEKEKPYASILQNSGKWDTEMFLGDEIHKSDKEGVCITCGKHPGKKKHPDEDGFICDLCDYDMSLGTSLPKANYICFHDNPTGHKIIPGVYVELIHGKLGTGKSEPFLVKVLSGDNNVRPETPLIKGYTASYIPMDEDNPLTFDDIMEKSQGLARLAYLKGDIDNLGYIFSDGFRKTDTGDDNIISISRIATLSRTLETFFSEYFESLLRNSDTFRNIYTVYSGGDDFLCLGPWNVMIDFARDIREKFKLFTCENPNWSISMGLILAGRHSPVLEAVDAADEYLEVSKTICGDDILPMKSDKNEINIPLKNRITLFGTSIPWDDFEDAYMRAVKIAKWLSDEDGTLSSGQVWRLRMYGEMYREWVRTKDTRFLEYIPLMAYDIRRNWTGKRLADSQEKALSWVRSLIVEPDVYDMKTLKFTCEYALLAKKIRESS